MTAFAGQDPDDGLERIPTLAEMARVFGRIGVLSFGGPAAQIALMQRELVEDRPWLSERQFLNALSFCMLLPGPEAMQLATYCGWRLRGISGGLIAGGLFVIPGALVILALAFGYVAFGDLPLVKAAFLGVQAAVVVIVFQALRGLARRTLSAPARWALAGLSFVAIFAFDAPFPLIILAAGLIGAARATGRYTPPPEAQRAAHGLRPLWIGLVLWLAPIAALYANGATLLTQIAVFFSKLALVTFGGAYAVLAYMTQEVVVDKGWLSTEQMIDALGLAETTPGPLILVTEFVGFLTGHAQGGPAMAVAAAAVTLWVTFVPCFIWIFTGAPYIEWIATRPRLSGALSAISAAVVGVILSLSVWFTLHVLFSQIVQIQIGAASLPSPDPASLRPRAVVLTLLAAVGLLGLRWPLPPVLALSALAGLGLGLVAI